MTYMLVIVAGPDRGKTFPLPDGETLVIGRGRQSTAMLNDLKTSRVHCQVTAEDDKVVLIDRGSTGGTMVNGQRVMRHELKSGDVIQLGDTQIRVNADDIPDMQTLAPGTLTRSRLASTPILPPDPQPVPVPPPPPPPKPRPAPPPVQAAPPRPAPLTTVEAAPPPDDPPMALPVTPAASSPPRLPGERLGELTGHTLAHYEIGPVLGRGQSGYVFRATDLEDGKVVAIKVMRPEFSTTEPEMQRFIRAMKTVLPLRHENLVALQGAGKKGPYCWIAMELIEGESLTRVIQRIGVAGMLDWRHAFRVAVHLGRALEFAHGRHVIHRNLTAQNVLVRESDKTTKLGDLMLAKALEGGLAENLTRPGELLGDIRFMSPERTNGTELVDERSDLYSLGALVYALLCGRAPFEGASIIETLTAIQRTQPEKPRKYQMSIPERFEDAVLTLLAKRPESRFQSARELLEDLARFAKYQGMDV